MNKIRKLVLIVAMLIGTTVFAADPTNVITLTWDWSTKIFNDGAVVNTVTIKNGLITSWTQV